MNDFLSLISHDAFRQTGLGKSAGEVFWFLRKFGPLTTKEVSERTGRSIRTVQRTLYTMSKLADRATGEFIPLVERQGETWYALDADLDHIARVVGTAGKAQKQREQYRQERKLQKQYLNSLKKEMEVQNDTEEI